MLLVLSRVSGGFLIFIGLVGMTSGLMMTATPGQSVMGAGVTWITLGTVLLGSLPFVPAVARKRWAFPDVAGLVLGTVSWFTLGALGVPDVSLVAVSVAALVLGLPAGYLVRRGFKLRPPAEAIVASDAEVDVTSGDASFDEKIAKLKPTPAVLRACVVGGLAGALTAMTGLQLLGVTFRLKPLNVVPYLLLLLGVVLVALVLRTYKMHATGAVGALGLAAFLALADGAWFVFSLKGGFISLFGMLSPPCLLVAAVLLWKALPAVRAASAVRQEMQDSGMELGF